MALEMGRVFHDGPSRALATDLDLRRQVLWLLETATTIATVGAGLIGRSWAFVFARAGPAWSGSGTPIRPCWRGCPAISPTMIADAGATPPSPPASPFSDAGRGAGALPTVQENGPENAAVKRAFADLDRLAAPDAVLPRPVRR